VKLVVSLHDVAPPYEPVIRGQIGALREAGVKRVVLKVVPNWHGAYPLSGSRSLQDLLREEVSRGSQIVLHGLQHRPHSSLRGSRLARLRGAVFAAGAAEFLTLSRPEAEQAVRAGMASLADAGLPEPSTFCAPGWLMTPETRRGVAAAGTRRIVTMFTLVDLPSGDAQWFAGIGHMGAGPWQERGVQVLNRIVAAACVPHAEMLRVYLHPQDGTGPAANRIIAQIASLVSRGCHCVTFDDL
jgi:predicted deacetylase